MAVSKQTSSPKTRVSVGGKNFLSFLLGLLAFLVFIPVATFATYYAFNYYGKADFMVQLFEQLQITDLVNSISEKFAANGMRRFNEVYVFYAAVSFLVLVLFSSKKTSGNPLLHIVYFVGTLAFLYYLALRILFPDVAMLTMLFNPPEMDIEAAITTLMENLHFVTCAITLLLFSISVIAADAGRYRANKRMWQTYEIAAHNEDDLKKKGSKRKLKQIKLSPTYWGLILVFVAQFIVAFYYIEDPTVDLIFKAAVSVIIPLVNHAVFKLSKMDTKLVYCTKFGYEESFLDVKSITD